MFVVFGVVCFLFFFKQKTAYDMRISDWSSDVCSSDLELDADSVIHLRRAPDVRAACQAALDIPGEPFLLSLRALQGIIGAHEWRKKGVAVPGLAQAIHVHYGVYSPNRGEYLDLLAQAPLPTTALAFDIERKSTRQN